MNPSKAFGPYEILDRISVGGMAEVFRARSRASGTIVALKRMLPQVAEDDEAIAMFEDEARICMRLENTHIARMLDFGRVDDSFFIAFEYVFGRDLRYVFDRAVRTKEEIPLKTFLYIFTRVGEGLAYAHARKDDHGEPISIVHRDVSPQNVVVSFDGDVKLIDFGIAKATGRLSLTQVGSIKGKFGYMSPEQVSGESVDARTDVFSLGICMWELLTLQRLFSGANELIVLEKIKNLAILPPSAVVGRRLPPELDRIILKALAKDPAERYRAAKDLYRELNHFSETHDLVANRGEIAQYMRRTFPEASGRDVAPRSGSSLPPRTLRDAAPETQRDVFRAGRGGVEEAEPESDRTVVRRNDEERMNMAAEKQSGSDLDIFEGLGKKASQTKTQTSAPPPPPSSLRAPPPVPSQPPQVVRGDLTVGKKTLLGVQSPLGGSAAPPSQRSIPAARGSLPDISAPPKKNTLAQSGAQPVAVPSAAETKPAGFADQPKAVASVEMDWDEDEEATHVLDRDDVKPPSGESPAFAKTSLASTQPSISRQAPPPSSASMMNRSVPQLMPQPRPSQAPPLPKSSAASMRPATSVSAPPPPPAPPSANFRSGPPAPPGSVSRPPPPPSMSQPPQQFGQMGQAAGSYPPPSAQNPFQQPIQTHTAPMAMPGPQQMQSGPPRAQSMAPSLPPVQSAPQIHMKSRMMEETQMVRPSSNRNLFIGLGLALVAVVAGIFLLMPHNAKLAINVVDSKGVTVNRVDVFVDGKKECETAPCILDVSSGAHEVKALAAGYDASSKAITVGKDTTIELSLTGGTGGATVAKTGTGIRVQGSQPGVKLSVDGKEIGPLPQDVNDLTPGDHKIKVAGSERYEPLEKNVTVAKDEMQDLGNISLKVVKGKATITLGTPGARVTLVSGNDHRDLPTFPISVDIDTSKSWTLHATKAGFTDYSQPISFADGQAEKTFEVTLTPKSAAASTYTPPATGGGTKTTTKPKTSGDTAGGEGLLTINSFPASAVVLDGKPLGQTPQLKISVSSGTEHTVTFINSDQNLKKTMKVTVGAGETKLVIAKLKSE